MILTEEWVMAYTACGIMVCFSAILMYYIELNVQLEDFKTFATGFNEEKLSHPLKKEIFPLKEFISFITFVLVF